MDINPRRTPSTMRPSILEPPRRNSTEEMAILNQSLRLGKFADPPSKKSLVIGGDLLTKRHVQLIHDLRQEAARVSFENIVLRDKATTFERRYRVAKIDRTHIKEQLALVQTRYAKIQVELEASQRFLQKVDALFSGEKTQRMARAMSLPGEELEGAQLLEQMGETPHFEFRNPFEKSRAMTPSP